MGFIWVNLTCVILLEKQAINFLAWPKFPKINVLSHLLLTTQFVAMWCEYKQAEQMSSMRRNKMLMQKIDLVTSLPPVRRIFHCLVWLCKIVMTGVCFSSFSVIKATLICSEYIDNFWIYRQANQKPPQPAQAFFISLQWHAVGLAR